MRKNRVLVLLIITSFIMPGCLDSVGDSEVDGDSSTNQQPVFYSWGYTFQYENNDDGPSIEACSRSNELLNTKVSPCIGAQEGDASVELKLKPPCAKCLPCQNASRRDKG